MKLRTNPPDWDYKTYSVAENIPAAPENLVLWASDGQKSNFRYAYQALVPQA
jgi:hypothetical protein